MSDDLSNTVSDRSVSESSSYSAYGAKVKTYPICHSSLDYKRSTLLVEPEEYVALSYDFKNIYKEPHDSYLEFLAKHLMFS